MKGARAAIAPRALFTMALGKKRATATGISNSQFKKGHGLISGKRGGMFPGNGLGANNRDIFLSDTLRETRRSG
jgi:hypothetical protein